MWGFLRRWAAPAHNQGVKRVCEDETIGIRQFKLEDTEPLYLAARESVEELCKWMVWCRSDYSLEDSRAFIVRSQAEWEKGSWYTFVIYDKHGGEFLGSIGLSAVDRVHGFAQLGYWVRKGRRGKGIGAAAVRLAAGYAFEELGIFRIELIIPVGNSASARVAENAGANLEGVLNGRVLLNGTRHNAAIYSLVRA